MAPIIYARDEDRAAARIGRRLVWFGFPALLGAYFLAEELLDWKGSSALLYAAVLVPLLAGLSVMIFNPPQGDRDWLRLDANGITLSRRGHQAQWHWSRVAAILPLAWWDLFGLLRGQVVRLKLAGGGSLTLSDDYFTPLDEIRDRLAEARARALGLEGFAGRPLSLVRVPPLVAEGPKVFRWRRDGSGGPTALLLLALAGAVALLWTVAAWSRELGEVGEWIGEAATAVIGGAAAAVFSIPALIRGRLPAGNFLLLSDDGLHLRHQGSRRHWRWTDVSGFALVRREADPEAGTDTNRVITFATRGSGGERAGPPDGAVEEVAVEEVAVEEVYEAPLEEILRRLEAWRAWAGPAGAVAVEEPGEAAVLSAGHRPGGGGGVLGQGMIWLGLAVGVLAGAGVVGLLARLGDAGIDRQDLWVWLAVLAAGALLLPLPILLSAWLAKRFSLEADGEGLALRRLGVTRRWSWDGLSAIESREAEVRWTGARRRLLVIGTGKDDRLSRLARWAYGLEGERPAVVIEDIFDRPLEEIAGRLEALRRAASAPGAERRGQPARPRGLPPRRMDQASALHVA